MKNINVILKNCGGHSLVGTLYKAVGLNPDLTNLTILVEEFAASIDIEDEIRLCKEQFPTVHLHIYHSNGYGAKPPIMMETNQFMIV